MALFSSPPTPLFSASPNSPRFAPRVRREQKAKHWKPRHTVSSWPWASRSPHSAECSANVALPDYGRVARRRAEIPILHFLKTENAGIPCERLVVVLYEYSQVTNRGDAGIHGAGWCVPETKCESERDKCEKNF